MAPALVLPAPATNAAFFVVFGVFVVAMVVLVVIIIVWAVRHDVVGRRAWLKGQQEAIDSGQADRSDEPGPYPVPQNRLQQRAQERFLQRTQQPQRPPRSSGS
jgi:hypothetical protein